MKVRGDRECQDCGTRWAYYETGSVECPNCGSPRSVGVDEERRLHTATAAPLDLTEVQSLVDEQPLRTVAERAVKTAREFTRGYGFISGGEVQPLDDTYLAAMELRMVADTVGRATSVTDDEESYFLSLLAGAGDGERPAREQVSDSLVDSRVLAYARGVEEYREDLRTYLDEHPDETASDQLGRLRGHVKRALALDGAISTRAAETLVEAARGIGAYVADGDETTLATTESRLDALEGLPRD